MAGYIGRRLVLKRLHIISQIVNGKKEILSVDYIGPSKYYSCLRGIGNDVLLAYSFATREIGGHLIFPQTRYAVNDKIEKSLNEIRSYRFKERIDYFLLELSYWYRGVNKVQASKEVFEGNRNWLMQFQKFEGFIDYFRLNDFVNLDYEVYDLTSYQNGKYTQILIEQPVIKSNGSDYVKAMQDAYIPTDYSKYIIGCTNAVVLRTKRMKKI